ncbi:hypothetical protein M9H77_25250 [Catharanthus roseus]|uniref:Uncharacterized protein n=1 Tax=Catharanthus roseus TaxID=4058 RepID=A0ACC0A6C9_CATRO|nr:hypothetical protein M9H77_25250 [Catharanthus roseus]
MAPLMTLEDLHLFHSIDREVFGRLIISLARDPAQALLAMAFWLCLEDLNFNGIILNLMSLSNAVLNGLVDEALVCLNCLESKTPPFQSDGLIPLTTLTVGRGINLTLIYRNKYTMITGIKAFLNNVCAIVFTDILVQVFPSRALYDYPLIIPGFPHPTFGPVTIIPRRPNYIFPSKGMWGWSLNIEAPVDDRTIFLTFSRGYPVTEAEVRELFCSHFGDSVVEEVSMEPSGSSSSSSSIGEQCLYARMVLRDISTVDRILSRGQIAKFKINGKHVWARKFERREIGTDRA